MRKIQMGPDGTAVSGGFVGRDRELGLLDTALRRGAGLVLVSGDPGMGKTALLREFGRRARADGARVLWGSAWEDGGAPPYWPWVQVLRQAGSDPFPDHLRGVAGETARFALFDAVSLILERTAEDAPLVVILDDLHAAGRPSALLLRFAAAAGPSRVLLVAAFRSAEARLDRGVREVIEHLEPEAVAIHLSGLAHEEIRQLLPNAGDTVVAAVARRGEGSPLFVAQVARLLGTTATTVDEVPVPATIRQAVNGLVERLDPGSADVLATAAALGSEVDAQLIAAVLDIETVEVIATLDSAAEVGLLQPGPTGYRFAHALIRDALLSDLPPLARAQRHRRIAAVLDEPAWQARAGHAELARHYRLAIPTGPDAAEATVRYATLAGDDALAALAPEEAAEHYQHALDALGRTALSTLEQRTDMLLRLGAALDQGGDVRTAQVVHEAIELARRGANPVQLAAAALLAAHHLDFNAPAENVTGLLREAADALPADQATLHAHLLARMAIASSADPPTARAIADEAVTIAQDAEPAAQATALAARHHTRWGTQSPDDALADARGIVTAAQQAHDRDTELDGRVLTLTHLLELGDGPAARRVLPELDRLAAALRHPAARLVALSRRATLATVSGDFGEALRCEREAWEAGRRFGLPDADAVRWGQIHAIWQHTDVPADELEWMTATLRDLVAHSHLSFAHAPALVQVEAATGALDQAHGRLDDLVTNGLDRERPHMMLVWTLTQLAEVTCQLGAAQHADRVYQALAPYAGRVAVGAGAVACSGATDFYLGRLATLRGDRSTAERHHRAALTMHRSLGARPMLARTLNELGEHTEARAIASDCGMTHLFTTPAPAGLTLRREGDVWLIAYEHETIRLPDSLGLRYLDLLTRSPDRELGALHLVQLAATTGAATAIEDLTPIVADHGDEILDARARAEYKRRLDDLDDSLAEAEQWHDTERTTRLRDERDFLIHELTAAAGLAGRPRRLGSDTERARLNVTRAIRKAITRIKDQAPATGNHLDASTRTGAYCSYTPIGVPDSAVRLRHNPLG